MRKFLGHYAPWFLVGLVAILIALELAPELPFGASMGVLFIAMIILLVLAYAIFAHNRGLCELCIGSVPLDASAVAGRYKFRFRVAHLFERKVYAAAYLAMIVGASLLYFHPVGKYACAAAQASLGYLLLAYATHQRLQPWCPHCAEGGLEEIVPTAPTPVSSTL